MSKLNALLYILPSTLIVILDQIIKNLFYNNAIIHEEVILFDFYLTKNFGIITGIPFNFSEIVVIFTLVILVLVIIQNKSYDLLVYFFIVLTGVVSNLIDKFRFGFVIDYINIFNYSHFNLSDLLIYIGCILIVWKLFKSSRNKLRET